MGGKKLVFEDKAKKLVFENEQPTLYFINEAKKLVFDEKQSPAGIGRMIIESTFIVS